MGPAQDAALAGHGDMVHGERSVGGMSARAQVLDWALRHEVVVDEYERRAARNLVWLVIVLAVLGLGIALFLSAAESPY